jgi:hypothetical protein
MIGLVEHLGTDPVATAPGSDFERRTAKELGDAEIWMLTQIMGRQIYGRMAGRSKQQCGEVTQSTCPSISC